MMIIINDDLLTAEETFICHQVNCMGVMGSGVAKQIKSKYPGAFDLYKSTCDAYKSREKLLGNCCYYYDSTTDKTIINLFGQYDYGNNPSVMYTRPDALVRGLENIKAFLAHRNMPQAFVAMPYKIGCGKGNGNWDEILSILLDSDVNISLYRQNRG